MKQTKLVAYLNGLLRIPEIEDDSKNGLQADGAAEVTRVAFAVDACQAAFKHAAAAGAQLLIVHHGLFWDKPLVLTGTHYRRVQTLLSAGVALYAAHLPLDLHPKFGNNIQLASALGARPCRAFGKHKRLSAIGFGGPLAKAIPLAELADRLARLTGHPPLRVLANGPRLVRRIGCISGGAAGMLDQAEAAGFDTYITGETSHSSYHEAVERPLNVVYGGHYATETVGLKALARHLEKSFNLETKFIDLPTGW